MATNTIYNPQTLAELDSSKLQGYGQGATGACAALAATNIDLALTDDVLITGLQLVTIGASVGDYCIVQVLIGGVVVATPIPGPWYVQANGAMDFNLVFPVKAIAGATLRVVYHATVILIVPTMSVNYKLWKILV